MTCPTFEVLLDFADKRLASDAASSVDAHVGAGCASCRTTVDWFVGFVASSNADLVEPPLWLTRKAVGLFAERRPQSIAAKVTRFVAKLVFDSLASSPSQEVVPVRLGESSGRHLLFSAPPYDVDLLVAAEEVPNRVGVTGQVLAAETADAFGVSGLDVVFMRDGETVATSVTSELGEFVVGPLEPGTYDVRLADRDREIVLSNASVELR